MSHTAWYTRCRRQQEAWKRSTAALPEAARAPGRVWVEERGHPRAVGPFPVALPETFAAHNLLPAVRDEALARFARHDVAWHMATPGPDGDLPCTHLLDSQVQCVNVLLSLAHDPDGLLTWVRTFEPDTIELVEVEDGSPVAFEWIGDADHLGEGRGRPRQRGRFVTSADAFLLARRPDGVTAVLVEWKYTEDYPHPVPIRSARGTDRREVYRASYERSSFADKPPLDAYFHEPHYQLLRQALLADGMARARERGVDRAVLAHVMPAGNTTLLATVPEGLRELGATVPEVWGRLLRRQVRYVWVEADELITSVPAAADRYLGESS